MRTTNPDPAPRAARATIARAARRTHARAWSLSRALRLHRVTPRHIAAAAVLATGLAGFTWERCGLGGCPDVARLVAYQPDGGTVLLDRDDEQFAVLRPVRREVIPLDRIPAHVRDAFIAIEDRRFTRHGGIDWVRVAGAAVTNLVARDVEEGASTITMQLARNAFPERLPATERTLHRKLLEARVARDIEQRFSKDDILELYLNHIYFGGGAYGVDAAARFFFGKPVGELRHSQAALLAAIVKAPSNYDPRRFPERARARRDLVLAAMEREGFLSGEHARLARGAELAVIERPPFRGREADIGAYFIEEVRKLVEDRLGEDVYTKRLRIHTTLDVNAQKAAEEELARQIRLIERGTYGRFNGERLDGSDIEQPEGSPYLQGAVVMLEVGTGDVLAMVGGRDHRVSTYNRALRSRRQAGSAFKPFVFAAALGQGFPPSQLIADEPVSIRLAANRSWEPENYDGDYYGLLTMRESLVSSRNVPTVRLASVIGSQEIASAARAAGIASDIPQDPAMALGAASVTPLELTAAYATFASLGDAVSPRMIRWVEGEDGDVLWQEGVQARQALDPAVAYVLTDILRDAVSYGTGTAVRAEGFRGPAAGKTGTTNDGRDAWFIGYTPDVVAGVWIGFDQPRPILRNASGGRLAAPVWGRMMRRVYDKRPLPETWRAPETVTSRTIDPYTGSILADGCWPRWGEPGRELFIRSMLPEPVCPRNDYGRGLITSILSALGFGRDDDDDRDRRRGGSRGAPASAEQLRIEELLGAPMVRGMPRTAQAGTQPREERRSRDRRRGDARG